MSKALAKTSDEQMSGDAAVELDAIDMMGRIKTYVDEHGGANFYALAEQIPHFVALRGARRCSIVFEGELIWGDITPTAANALRGLFKLRWVLVELTYGDRRNWTLRPAPPDAAVIVRNGVPFTTSPEVGETPKHPSEPHIQLHDDTERYFCPKCQRTVGFETAELLFCAQKEMPCVQASVHEDNSTSEKVISSILPIDEDNDPGLTLTLFLSCGICKQRQVHEIRIWDPHAE